jgi:hypothetical protein
MRTARSRARWVRGGLVGVSSAAAASGAHAASGGALPQSSALVLMALMCAIVGAALAGVTVEGRLRLPAVIGGLITAQAVGHLTLSLTAHHHGDAPAAPTMLLAHLAGAIVLGAAITIVEYFYVVCASLLTWLRLFALARQRATARLRRIVTREPLSQRVFRCSGLGMRAPPCGIAPAV